MIERTKEQQERDNKYLIMHVLTHDEAAELKQKRIQKVIDLNDPKYNSTINFHKEQEQKRKEKLLEFPHSVVVEAAWPTFDFANRWCWRNFGTQDGVCHEYHSEYPACDLVLATEFYAEHPYKDADGLITEYREIEYKNPGDHSHTGIWTTGFGEKTDYDYGYSEYFFKNKENLDLFVENIPTFNLGEKYD